MNVQIALQQGRCNDRIGYNDTLGNDLPSTLTHFDDAASVAMAFVLFGKSLSPLLRLAHAG